MIGTAEHLKIYTLAVGEGGRIMGEIGSERSSDDAGQEVHTLTEKHMAETGERDYRRAMHFVLNQNPGLKKIYGS